MMKKRLLFGFLTLLMVSNTYAQECFKYVGLRWGTSGFGLSYTMANEKGNDLELVLTMRGYHGMVKQNDTKQALTSKFSLEANKIFKSNNINDKISWHFGAFGIAGLGEYYAYEEHEDGSFEYDYKSTPIVHLGGMVGAKYFFNEKMGIYVNVAPGLSVSGGGIGLSMVNYRTGFVYCIGK